MKVLGQTKWRRVIMADVYVNAFVVVAKSQWTPEMKQRIGKAVLEALYCKWQENQSISIPEDITEFLASKNHSALTTITVNTS